MNSSKTRQALRVRYGDNCHICGYPMLFNVDTTTDPLYATLDHIIPKSSGRKNIPSNVKLAHRVCNIVRGPYDITYELSTKMKDDLPGIILRMIMQQTYWLVCIYGNKIKSKLNGLVTIERSTISNIVDI